MDATRMTLISIKGGWAAIADDWAVFGKTEEEAIAQFNQAKNLHEEIVKRAASDNKISAPAIRL